MSDEARPARLAAMADGLRRYAPRKDIILKYVSCTR